MNEPPEVTEPEVLDLTAVTVAGVEPDEVAPEIVTIVEAASAALESLARLRELRDEDEYLWAAEQGRIVAAWEHGVVADMAKLKKATYEAHRRACDMESRSLRRVRAAKVKIKARLDEWLTREERRLAVEAAEREAAQRAQLQEGYMREALALESVGDTAAAAVVMAEAETITVPVVTSTPVKAPGVVRRTEPAWEMLDESKLKRDFLRADDAAITAAVKRLKKGAESVVGDGAIRVYEKTSVAIRR